MIWGAVEMEQVLYRMCTCKTANAYNIVHEKGCPYLILNSPYLGSQTAPSPPKKSRIVLPWKAQRPALPLHVTRKRWDRIAESSYKLTLQFYFQRPINISCWKCIRAPRGWRKCPTNKGAQLKYYGVRFQCRDLKYALTPKEIEQLQARLYLSLELVF